MKASEEFAIRLRKALDHFEGAKELGLPRRQMAAELVRLCDDDDLIDRLRDEDERGGNV